MKDLRGLEDLTMGTKRAAASCPTALQMSASERRGRNSKLCKDLFLKPRPESGLDCIMILPSSLHSGAFVPLQVYLAHKKQHPP